MNAGAQGQSLSIRLPGVRQILTGWVICTFVALFFSSQRFINPDSSGSWQDWWRALSHYLVTFYVWGFLSIGIIAIAARLELDRENWIRGVIRYALIGIGFCIAHIVLSILVMRGWRSLWAPGEPFETPSPMHLVAMAQSDLLFFVVITSVCLALSYYRKYRDREVRASRLKAQLTQSQLDVLRSRLQPHFLFNTLNAIAALVRHDARAAEAMIVRLSELLRTILENGNRQEVTLQQELEFCNRYLEIEMIRFGDRLTVTSDIDPATTSALVPSMILQPLVENAVRHGVARTSRPCRISILTKRQDSRLYIDILDTGPGSANNPESGGNGIGMFNTRDRLQHLFGDDFELTCGNRADGGFAVHVRLPWHLTELKNLELKGDPE